MDYISLVTTAYNEEENIPDLVARADKVLSNLSNTDYEIVIVDNGSFDGTAQKVCNQIDSGRKVKLVRLSRNFGYQGGLDAGLCHAQGDWIFIVDADLQDPPELLPTMLDKAKTENLDLVYGIRSSREETIFRKVCFWLFYRFWKAVADIPVVIDSGDCCLISKKSLDVIREMPERVRFFRGQRLWVGLNHGGLPYHRKDRQKGNTKFNFSSALALAFDGIFAYSFFPIRLMSIIGFMVLIPLFFTVGLYVVGKILVLTIGQAYFLPTLPSGFTILTLTIAVFFGVNFIFLSFLGEYLARIYEEVRSRPRFIVQDIKSGSLWTKDK